ncbi:MAG: energy-coupling factor transporter transmembrane protein EcfT [Ruminococcus sp.]|uniref:energy-coupling factor transporter transmembrane component T family protein n=1 Tax=Ruminococcus sp. TaxID=41978 RepID=UPI002872E553|nr:energy-coupling factor transporter transmembrane component T [Ruminococcus sp.]MBQ3284126.1 energy-coupling factor transporter transmembrane protein EcfT [Ruminococcus sp.]
MRDITLGQYFPADSVIHRLDPRVKILSLIVYIVLIFCTFNVFSLAFTAITVMAIVLMTKVPIKSYLKSLKVIIVIVIITSILNLFYGTGVPIFEWWIIKVTWEGIRNAVFVCVRIICLILLSSVLTFTTSPTDLTDALERLMKPLKVFHIKVHEIAMMMTIALRFVPTLLEETDKIMAAQKARGADMESGNLFTRVKALVPVLVPLFVSAFRRAYELAVAMECRCYRGGDGRTRMKQLHMVKRDYICIVITLLVIACVVLLNIFGFVIYSLIRIK